MSDQKIQKELWSCDRMYGSELPQIRQMVYDGYSPAKIIDVVGTTYKFREHPTDTHMVEGWVSTTDAVAYITELRQRLLTEGVELDPVNYYAGSLIRIKEMLERGYTTDEIMSAVGLSSMPCHVDDASGVYVTTQAAKAYIDSLRK